MNSWKKVDRVNGTTVNRHRCLSEIFAEGLRLATLALKQHIQNCRNIEKEVYQYDRDAIDGPVNIQRKLQLQIEEQGKYLEIMFERTKDIGKDLKVSSLIIDEHPSPSTETKHSPPNDKSEALEKDPVSSNNCSSSSSGGKSPDKKVSEDHDSDSGESGCSPPSKRARTEERSALYES
ncbi:hypothetical protein CQW23_13121 [Capsicum baccatum]|uniref:MYB-CC type transcription factor LHEQLE-containing domain-containing protein n=1 Tax=Capsicum baccatum TaxID=33114 RepID=A0A2G2WUK8_CAPBA|nr:hypothetical protein CQW23_13121 [Capsicum baccatum]